MTKLDGIVISLATVSRLGALRFRAVPAHPLPVASRLSSPGRRRVVAMAFVSLMTAAAPRPAGGQVACVGDCDANGVVVVNELITMVNILLERAALTACPSADQQGDGKVAVNEVVGGVNSLLRGCAATATATPVDPTSAPTATALATTPSPTAVGPSPTPTATADGTRTPAPSGFVDEIDRVGLGDLTNIYGRGASSADFDGDGWEDLFVTDAGTGYPWHHNHSRLYRNQGDGTFREFDPGWPAEAMAFNWSSVWADFDNDGDSDLFLVNGGYGFANRSRLFRNDLSTGGRFVDVSDAAGILASTFQAWGASFGDFDGDGNLDLVVTARGHGDHATGGTAGGLLEVPAPILLYHNTGRGTFVEKGQSLYLRGIVGDTKNPLWFDYDADGDLDLYVAGFQDHALFRNDGDSGFTEVTEEILASQGAMPPVFSAAAEDFDQDGWVDLYLGRWDHQDLLMRNKRDGTFEALGREIGLDMFSVDVTPPGEISASHENTMAIGIADLDANGYPDIIIGTGTPIIATPSVVLCNEGAPLRFHRCMPEIVNHGPSRNHGMVFADFDHDGDLDFFFNRGGAADFDNGEDGRPATPDATTEKASFYVNHPLERPRTAALRLRGTTSNRDAVGAKIEISSAEGTRYHWVRSQQAFVSQDGPWYLALVGESGAAATIHWPSGRISTVQLLQGDRIEVVEPD